MICIGNRCLKIFTFILLSFDKEIIKKMNLASFKAPMRLTID